ncbi:MAG: cupin domain-containing protein [Nitrospirae bacterium]|nr:cupin domain-containing protein [Nitrospirota bacterium]
MILKTAYKDLLPYRTKDGSTVRELMHPALHGNTRQSLAEAVVPVGGTTFLHRHLKSEELYHITQGQGLMFLGREQFEVMEGDTVYIPPGTPHKIRNTGQTPLKILCCSSPAYSHDDTELLP